MRPIDADKLIEWLTNPTGFLANYEDCNSYGRECVLCIVEEAIQNAPTIEVEPVRHAQWKNSDFLPGMLTCTNCGAQRNPKFKIGGGAWNGCPNCRAKMDGGQ